MDCEPGRIKAIDFQNIVLQQARSDVRGDCLAWSGVGPSSPHAAGPMKAGKQLSVDFIERGLLSRATSGFMCQGVCSPAGE